MARARRAARCTRTKLRAPSLRSLPGSLTAVSWWTPGRGWRRRRPLSPTSGEEPVLRWMKSWPVWSAAAFTYARPSCASWLRIRTRTMGIISWRRSGRAWSCVKYGDKSEVWREASHLTPWRGASTRRSGALRRRRPSRTQKMRCCHLPSGRAELLNIHKLRTCTCVCVCVCLTIHPNTQHTKSWTTTKQPPLDHPPLSLIHCISFLIRVLFMIFINSFYVVLVSYDSRRCELWLKVILWITVDKPGKCINNSTEMKPDFLTVLIVLWWH